MNTSSFGNPILSGDKLLQSDSRSTSKMSRAGVAWWLVLHIAVLLCTATFTWSQAFKAWGNFDFNTLKKVETGEKNSEGKAITKMVVVDKVTGAQSPVPKFDMRVINTLMVVGLIGGLITGAITIFANRAAPITGPLYAAFQGFGLGAISAMYEVQFGGIVMQALASTILVMVAMYFLFTAKILRATGPFIAGVLACMLGVLGVYLVDIVMQVFWGTNLSIVHGNSLTAIAFSVIVCALAAFNFIIDFQSIEEGIEGSAPAYMNAYAAFGVLVTLLWLYLEILRLLAKIKSRD